MAGKAVFRLKCLVFAFAALATAQSTQGLIGGYIRDSLSGSPIRGAAVTAVPLTAPLSRTVLSDGSGYYVIPLLTPGLYRLRVTAAGYQDGQLDDLRLPVAATLQMSFRIRPLSDVWERKQYQSVFLPGKSVLPFYGPDVDPSRSSHYEAAAGDTGVLETTVSHVIDPGPIERVPLTNRDVYALVATLPGVTTEQATGRGLGLSVQGMRPSSSNFLLDGLENNSYLITGPLFLIAPEAVQEYRVSTSNFTAEYGRTPGYLANAVTRAGGSAWHGLLYFYARNEIFNANDFRRKRNRSSRPPTKELQPGISAGGPVLRDRLFASLAAEHRRFRSLEDPIPVRLPSTSFRPQPGTVAERLMADVSSADLPSAQAESAVVARAPPAHLDRTFVLPRIDWIPSRLHRLMVRATVARLLRPDFLWTPYRNLSAPLTENSIGFAGNWLATWKPTVTNELRLGWNRHDLRFDRRRPDIPNLVSEDHVLLPQNPAFYSYRNRNRSLEVVENLMWVGERHIFKAGGGFLRRRLDGYLTAGGDGFYQFASLQDFGADKPRIIRVALDRTALAAGRIALPDFNRQYDYDQYHLFIQDSWRSRHRLTFDYGVRYESFGAPRGVGAAGDVLLPLGPGAAMDERIRTAGNPERHGRNIFSPDRNNWGIRLGASWSPTAGGETLIRGSYGTFYDRPFDNLWQNIRNNSFVLASEGFSETPVMPVEAALPLLADPRPDRLFSRLSLYPENLRSPLVHSYFAGVHRRLGRSLLLEVNGSGSHGRDLLTTDLLNRDFSVPFSFDNPLGRWNSSLPLIYYRANQGSSDYHALGMVLRYRGRRTQFHIAYTWSHSIDNQSEALAGDFFNLFVVRPGGEVPATLVSAFSEQAAPQGDRGSSDFDQRHNLVMVGFWESPVSWRSRWLRLWRLSATAAIRSGLPYTVTSAFVGPVFGGPTIFNRRADLLNPDLASAIREPKAGAVRLLNPAAFAAPPVARQGTAGRNSFAGPGFYSLDLSASRSFSASWLGEQGRLTVRLDAFNVWNHANLDRPVSILQSSRFGEADFGRIGRESPFPALTPFRESARELQWMLRLEF